MITPILTLYLKAMHPQIKTMVNRNFQRLTRIGSKNKTGIHWYSLRKYRKQLLAVEIPKYLFVKSRYFAALSIDQTSTEEMFPIFGRF